MEIAADYSKTVPLNTFWRADVIEYDEVNFWGRSRRERCLCWEPIGNAVIGRSCSY